MIVVFGIMKNVRNHKVKQMMRLKVFIALHLMQSHVLRQKDVPI